ncbi:MAG: 4Fe-4S binding protein [Coriobacteriales bacterium]|jgi:ferredoxin|nr:4Fe-4S binding protein [Coriobacteriales bacterium]
MTALEDKLRERAGALLESGEVGEVIAWGAGRFSNQTTPLFVRDAARAGAIVANEHCVNTLATYVSAERDALVAAVSERAASGADGAGAAPAHKVAVCVRGCDSRGINRMIADKQVRRDEVYLLGIPCRGVKDRATGEMLARCMACAHPNPVVYDELLGEAVTPDPAIMEAVTQERFSEVEAIEALSREERRAHFDDAFSRCIRCYACREVCPVCTCRECFVDQQRAGWQGKQNNLNENRFYSLTRVFHIGDRCIECGECARVCPMELPLMELNRKFIKDLSTLFAAGEEGLTDELDNALGRYDVGDVEEFM